MAGRGGDGEVGVVGRVVKLLAGLLGHALDSEPKEAQLLKVWNNSLGKGVDKRKNDVSVCPPLPDVPLP